MSRNPHLDDEDLRDLPDFLRELLAHERQAAGPAYNRRAARPPVVDIPSEMPPAAPVDARPVAAVRTVPAAAPRPVPRRQVRMPDADPRRTSSQGRLL
ncbi:hypothetical protein SAMN02799631_00321 [Methylobacterium sp. 174MFSha1.1]|uniref:hypothetical protein n=1 Tax=Methylobacterium sp. 174MFSha1.1 TaxID=1502749 RepID=UPI0008E38D63|nr:hypothetical protein [Methylobacterium sp. 174MFSha1.1]SFU35605.1 hypothetical protein SAMN02799631_00321 [Methylobacterium sp. 174MFSha1.1]